MSRPLSSMLVGGSHVFHLGDLKSLDEFCDTGAAVLLSIVVSLSGRCQSFFPIFDDVAALLSVTGSEVTCAQIEATNTKIGSKFAIRYYPTVILYHGPQDFKIYQGPLRKDDIIAYLRRQEMPTVTSIDSPDQLYDLRRRHNTVIVAFLDPNDGASRDCFRAVANDMKDDFVFCISNHPNIVAQEEASIPSVVLYKTVAEKISIFRHLLSTEGISDFVKAAAQPLVNELLPELHEEMLQRSLPLGYIFVSSRFQQQQAGVDFLSVARKYHGHFQMHTVDVHGFPGLVEKMHVQPSHWPAFAIHQPTRNYKYPLNCQDKSRPSLESEEVDRFIESFLAGKLKPTIKSQAIPGVQVGAVVEIVGVTYEDMVLNSDKDVLVEFYTEWCGPCKTLRPEYERLAWLYTSDSKARDLITIAKVDYEKNDVPDMDVRGFPWFKLYPAGRKGSPVTYTGEFRVSAWAAFIAERGAHRVLVE